MKGEEGLASAFCLSGGLYLSRLWDGWIILRTLHLVLSMATYTLGSLEPAIGHGRFGLRGA